MKISFESTDALNFLLEKLCYSTRVYVILKNPRIEISGKKNWNSIQIMQTRNIFILDSLQLFS